MPASVHARESCPIFLGATTRLHQSFDDPAAYSGPEEERLARFRRVDRPYLRRTVARAGGKPRRVSAPVRSDNRALVA